MDNYSYNDYTDRARASHEIYQYNNMGGKNNHNVSKHKTSLVLIIVACVLIVALALFLAYFFFVHPIDKLMWKLDKKNNFTMYMTLENNFVKGQLTMWFEDNYIKTELTASNTWFSETTYYELRGDELYTYSKKFTSDAWESELAAESLENSIIEGTEALFEKDNYERVEGKWFSWKLKEDIDSGAFSDIIFTQNFGQFSITGKVYMEGKLYDITINFTRIGNTKVNPPWLDK